MLSVNYCKNYFKTQNKYYSDKEIEEIMDNLYQTAEVLTAIYSQKKYPSSKPQKQSRKTPLYH